jgi:hypothetical protein
MNRPSAMALPRFRRLAPLFVLLAVAGPAADALAQSATTKPSNPRSTFPGRRIGGGTRGECSARLIAHLVPNSSVFAPGTPGTLGILEGPSASPSPLLVEFRPLSGGGTTEAARSAGQRRTLPASSAGITLFNLPPVRKPTVWESSYRCGGEPGATTGGDPLDFVSAEAPPALSLLVSDGTRDDAGIRANLQKLRGACGSTVPRAEVGSAFGLSDVITSDWPARIPVRCPG